MSNLVTAICQTRKFGSAPLKAVAMYMADRASDDGSGIWTSKAHIAQDTELSKRTVQNAIKDLVTAGLVYEVGQRRHQHGYTIEYSISISAVKRLASTRENTAQRTGAGGAPVQEVHPTGAGDSPHGVQEIHPNHPITILEPSNISPLTPQGGNAGVEPNQPDLLPVASPQQSKRQPKVAGGLWEGCASTEDEFDQVWPHYPRRVSKGAARKAWMKARRAATFDEITKPLGTFIRLQKNTPMDKIPHLSTWLNGERWADDQTHAINRAETTSDRLNRLHHDPDEAADALPGRSMPQIEWNPQQ